MEENVALKKAGGPSTVSSWARSAGLDLMLLADMSRDNLVHVFGSTANDSSPLTAGLFAARRKAYKIIQRVRSCVSDENAEAVDAIGKPIPLELTIAGTIIRIVFVLPRNKIERTTAPLEFNVDATAKHNCCHPDRP